MGLLVTTWLGLSHVRVDYDTRMFVDRVINDLRLKIRFIPTQGWPWPKYVVTSVEAGNDGSSVYRHVAYGRVEIVKVGEGEEMVRIGLSLLGDETEIEAVILKEAGDYQMFYGKLKDSFTFQFKTVNYQVSEVSPIDKRPVTVALPWQIGEVRVNSIARVEWEDNSPKALFDSEIKPRGYTDLGNWESYLVYEN